MEDYNNNMNQNNAGNDGWQNGGNGYDNGAGWQNGNGWNNGGWQNGGYNGGPSRRLIKSPTNRMVCGVCAGIAEYFGWDPTIVRIIWVAASMILGVGFFGLIAYFIVAVIMPDA